MEILRLLPLEVYHGLRACLNKHFGTPDPRGRKGCHSELDLWDTTSPNTSRKQAQTSFIPTLISRTSKRLCLNLVVK